MSKTHEERLGELRKVLYGDDSEGLKRLRDACNSGCVSPLFNYSSEDLMDLYREGKLRVEDLRALMGEEAPSCINFYSEGEVVMQLFDEEELAKYALKPAERHATLCIGLNETYVKKNADYGDSFEKSLDKHGLIAAAVRMDDKMGRFENLIVADRLNVTDESMADTLLDLANYCIMTVMWMEKCEK